MARLFFSIVVFISVSVLYWEDYRLERDGIQVVAEVMRVDEVPDGDSTKIVRTARYFDEAHKEKWTTVGTEFGGKQNVVGSKIHGICHPREERNCKFERIDVNLGSAQILFSAAILLILAIANFMRNNDWLWHRSLVPGTKGNVLRLRVSLLVVCHNMAIFYFCAGLIYAFLSVSADSPEGERFWTVLVGFFCLPGVFYFIGQIFFSPYLELNTKGMKYKESWRTPFVWPWESMGGVAFISHINPNNGVRVLAKGYVDPTSILFWKKNARASGRVATISGYHSKRSTLLDIPLGQYGNVEEVTKGIKQFVAAIGREKWLNQPPPST